MSTILKDILAVVVPHLRAMGFKGSGQNYRKANDKAVCIINFQKSSGGQHFYVNVGVQPLFVPTEGESVPDAKKIKEPACIFRTRVNPPAHMPGWRYSLKVADALVSELQSTYANFVEPLITIPGPVTEVSLSDFSDSERHPLFGVPNGTKYLHFSRIANAIGDKHKAVEFATAGIAICSEQATYTLSQLEQALAAAST